MQNVILTCPCCNHVTEQKINHSFITGYTNEKKQHLDSKGFTVCQNCGESLVYQIKQVIVCDLKKSPV